MKAIGQAQGALAALAELLPDEAERVGPEREVSPVALSELVPGDVVLVRSGVRVPADGTIVDGAAEVDESMITGESRPVPKAIGDRVVAGTVSTDSSIRVQVTAVGDETTLAGIQRLVAEAQASGGRAQALADRFAALLFYVATTVESLAWAAGYNVVAIPLAAGVLAWAGITLSPAVGAILMSLSTIVVALNAQLLRRVDLTPEPAGGAAIAVTPENQWVGSHEHR